MGSQIGYGLEAKLKYFLEDVRFEMGDLRLKRKWQQQ